jgi:hypothetical protein
MGMFQQEFISFPPQTLKAAVFGNKSLNPWLFILKTMFEIVKIIGQGKLAGAEGVDQGQERLGDW